MNNKKTILSEDEYFSYKAREVMKEKHITRQKLADDIFVNISTLATYLKNQNPITPPLTTATRIAKVLGVPLDYLAGTNDIKEFNTQGKVNAGTMLKNLYHVIKDTHFEIQLNGNLLMLKSENRFVQMFLSQINPEMNDNEVNALILKFDDLKVLDGELIDRTSYDFYNKNSFKDYVYGDITKEQKELYYDECAEVVSDRIDKWKAASPKETYKLLDEIKERGGK